MNRLSEAEMLDFCARQRESFHPEMWTECEILPREETAAVALFLASVDWFGYRDELLGIAELLQPGCAGSFAALARRTNFDCSRFSTLLRRKLDHAPSAA